MDLLNKVRKFLLLESKTKRLFMEAFFYLGLARLLISIPFSKVAPSLGEPMKETTNIPIAQNRAALIDVYEAIRIISNNTFWESKCLVRAIAGMKMLNRRGIESTLYLGTARDETGKMIAHAWLRSGPFYISGAEEMDRFTVVGKFAKTANS